MLSIREGGVGMSRGNQLERRSAARSGDLRIAFRQWPALLPAVDGIDFGAAGETYALLGESGCGKSATALGAAAPAAGCRADSRRRYALRGRDLLCLAEAEMRGVRGGGMAMIFQEPATSLNPVLTVGHQIGEVLERHLGLRGEAARERSLELLDAVGIADAPRRLDEYPFQLSGGMKQRVMIAIALAGNPRLLIADEPTTALDVTIQAQILDLLRQLQAERGMGMLLITHDLGVVAQMATRVGVMYAGQIVEEAPREAFFSAPRIPTRRNCSPPCPIWNGAEVCSIRSPDRYRRSPQCPPAAASRAVASTPGNSAGSRRRNGGRLRLAIACAAIWMSCLRLRPASAVGAGSAALRSGVDQVAAPALLSVKDLRVHFPIRRGILQRTVGQVRAVDGVSLELARGRTLALVGESGCGKTTVGKAILQLIAASGGSVHLLGQELGSLTRKGRRPLRRRMQMIFQDPFASLNPRMAVGEIIGEGMSALRIDMQRQGRGAAIAAVLEQVGLEAAAASRYPHEFSGGQRQRIAIARALAVQPDLVICDEPTSALDVSVQAQILNLLATLQADLGLAYLFITHNFAVVDHLAHEVAVMYLGRIVERGTVDEVLRSPQHPYTRALLSAVPSTRLDAQPAFIRLPGETPSPANPPSGCHFHPRCRQATAVCRERYPETTALSSTHTVRCHLHA
jgi:peptide/nickel transport system ATP-binding protein